MKKFILSGLLIILIGLTAFHTNSISTEFKDAYSRAKENGITTMDTIKGARMNDGLTREEMAKMISNYAKNILGKTPDTTKSCYFIDSNINPDLVYFVTESCQLGLMGQGVSSFRPKDSVTRAEFGTVLSRLLYGNQYEGGKKYYTNHLQALQNNGIMNNISNPYMKEVRGYVMIMMQRSSLKYGKNINENTTFTGINKEIENKTNSGNNNGEPPVAATVTNVIDGDTISIKLNGETISVRLIGVDSPEKTTKRYGYTECYGEDSAKYLSKLLNGKNIYLEYDESQGLYDSYDRILAYVFLNGENINEKIIRNGYGWEYTYNKPYKYQSDFKQAQKLAEKNNLGVWNTCNGERIPLEKENTNNTTTHTSGDIKGNINSKGEKIYHAPGCPHYEKTVITESKGEKRFSTTQEAEAAGWRACIN